MDVYRFTAQQRVSTPQYIFNQLINFFPTDHQKTKQHEAIDTNTAYLHNIQDHTKASKIENTPFSPKTIHMQPLTPTMHTCVTHPHKGQSPKNTSYIYMHHFRYSIPPVKHPLYIFMCLSDYRWDLDWRSDLLTSYKL
jgi:hypothetical protein